MVTEETTPSEVHVETFTGVCSSQLTVYVLHESPADVDTGRTDAMRKKKLEHLSPSLPAYLIAWVREVGGDDDGEDVAEEGCLNKSTTDRGGQRGGVADAQHLLRFFTDCSQLWL